MCAVDASCEDEFSSDDAHGLFLEVGRYAGDNGGVVQEALMTDSYIGGEACLSFVVLTTEGRDIASGGFGKARETAGEVEELCGGQRSDEGGEIGGKEIHSGLDVGGQDVLCTI